MSAFKTWLTGLTSKTTPVDADEIYLRDSVGAASNKLTWANVKAAIKAYWESVAISSGGISLSHNGSTGIVGRRADNEWKTLINDYSNIGAGTGLTLIPTDSLHWSDNPANSLAGTADLAIFRDAPNVLAQRNGTNAQTFRTYGTWTDASNYRRVALAMTTAGVATIAPEGAGTGASGNVLHISGLPTSNPGAGILWNDAGTVKVGT